jgi:uncharacterized membrane protein
LNYLGFAGTYGLFFAAMKDYDVTRFWQVMPFLIAFFAIYSTSTILFNLVNRKKSTLLEVLGLLINAGVFFGVGHLLIRDAFGKEWGAALSLGLASFYIVHIYYLLLRRLMDRELMLSFTALAAFFLAVTIPLVLSREWITATWAIQALVMLWIAGKLESEFLRHLSYALFGIVLCRFGFLDLHRQYASPAAASIGVSLSAYLWQMVERVTALGVPIASFAGAGWLVKRTPSAAPLTVARDNDIGRWIRPSGAIAAVAAVVTGMLFVALHLELNRSLGYFCPAFRLPGLSLLWIALGAFLLSLYLARPIHALLGLFLACCGLMVLKLFVFDMPSWQLLDTLHYQDYLFLDAGMRLLDFGAVIAFLCLGWRLLSGTANRAAGQTLGAVALALLFIMSSLEVNSFLYHFVPGLRAGGVSILWSVFALSMILAGIWKNTRVIRYVGLTLFAVVAGKVLLFDLARLDQVYRIIAFLVLGVMVLLGSFVYLKYRPAAKSGEGKDGDL